MLQLAPNSGVTPPAVVYSSPAVVGGVVYIGSDDGNVYALNAANGAKLWSYHTAVYCFVSCCCQRRSLHRLR